MKTTSRTLTKEGDIVQLVSPTNKTFIVRLIPGGQLHTHRGILNFDELIGQPWGNEVITHTGKTYFMLPPSLSDLLRETHRNTQIMYPKDIGFVGTGSGAMTTALAWAVGPQGHIISYEIRQEMQNLALKNLDRLGLLDRVTLKLRDIAEGFDEEAVDALFMDVPNPFDYLLQVRQALKPGGYYGCILPTTNQISHLLVAFHRHGFAFVEVCEIILRYYKPVAERLRPTDRMVAHTGYLIFARPIIQTSKDPQTEKDDSARYKFDITHNVEELSNQEVE